MTEPAAEPEPVDPGHEPGVDPPPDEETPAPGHDHGPGQGHQGDEDSGSDVEQSALDRVDHVDEQEVNESPDR